MINKLELRRQTFHFIAGTGAIVLLYYNIINVKFLIFITILGFISAYIAKKHNVKAINWFLERFEREENIKTFPGKGAIFLVFGITLAFLLFDRDIALAAGIILSVGDSIATLIGPFGKMSHIRPFSQKKLIEGTLAGILFGFIGAAFFVSYKEAFFASFIAMAFEAIEIELFNEKLDDNIIIPLVAGIVITLMRLYF